MSGGTDEALKNLQNVSAEADKMYQDIGAKPWAQGLVQLTPTTQQKTNMGIAAVAPWYLGYQVTKNVTQASGRLIQLKLDSETTKNLMSGQTVTLTSKAAMAGT